MSALKKSFKIQLTFVSIVIIVACFYYASEQKPDGEKKRIDPVPTSAQETKEATKRTGRKEGANQVAQSQEITKVPQNSATDDSTTRSCDFSNIGALKNIAADFALLTYPDGAFNVDLSTSKPRDVFKVKSHCKDVPDYFIASLYKEEFLSGLVIMNAISEDRLELATIHPIGPAYINDDAMGMHGSVRDTTFPPFSEDDARYSLAEAYSTKVETEIKYLGYSYICDGDLAGPQIGFNYEFEVNGESVHIDALSGVILGQDDEEDVDQEIVFGQAEDNSDS